MSKLIATPGTFLPLRSGAMVIGVITVDITCPKNTIQKTSYQLGIIHIEKSQDKSGQEIGFQFSMNRLGASRPDQFNLD